MTESGIVELRRRYHRSIFDDVLRVSEAGLPNNADRGSKASVRIANGIVEQIGMSPKSESIPGQTAGNRFEGATRDFLQGAFDLLQHLRPGEWRFSVGGDIQQFVQYRHLSDVAELTQRHKELRTVFGDYIVKPDIVVRRNPESDETLNAQGVLVHGADSASHTPLRRANSEWPILHASVSCKWTIRSDRSQNARTEGLNLIRNRKGKSPHIVVVTAEPLPTRIASLALGTGDIDCVYHFALPELEAATEGGETDRELVEMLVTGDRLRDITDLPFDLVT
ncbi:MAG: restriction endonuclease [Gammaproteobacteria bacterium]|nr:restriction endonuclease [Gammaproteobacteria bacterium]